jgi:hypothetical protein
VSVTSIFADPPVGQVDPQKPTTLGFEGTPVGNDVRWFLRAKPLGSTLAPDTELEGPAFAPDAPGRYVIGLKDVTVTTPVARWEGDPLATQVTDDEATAPETQLVYWVAETIKRPLNAGRGAATLALSTYDDQADETRPALVTLVPVASSGIALGADALADPYLVGILAELRTSLALSTFLGPSVDFLRDLWRGLFLHMSGATRTTHGVADATDTTAGTPTTLATCRTLLAATATELLAHQGRGLPVHGQTSGAAIVTPLGTSLADACAYAGAVDRALSWHATTVDVPTGGNFLHGTSFADWTEGRWREPPYDLPSLCAFASDLAARLAAHKAREALFLSAHLTGAANLPNPFADGMPSALAFAAIGQMVDAFSAHVTSFTGDTPSGAHTAKRPPPGITKPNDPVGCARAAEALALALEEHALDKAAHGGHEALGLTRVRAGSNPETARWPYTLRLSARLAALVGSATPPVPDNRNAAAVLSKTFGGWT